MEDLSTGIAPIGDHLARALPFKPGVQSSGNRMKKRRDPAGSTASFFLQMIKLACAP